MLEHRSQAPGLGSFSPVATFLQAVKLASLCNTPFMYVRMYVYVDFFNSPKGAHPGGHATVQLITDMSSPKWESLSKETEEEALVRLKMEV